MMDNDIERLLWRAYLPVYIHDYGCTFCNCVHRTGDPEFVLHLVFQCPLGVRKIDVYTAIIETWVAATLDLFD